MGLTSTDATELVEQLQHAHRISVAFYRRILPAFDTIAADLDLQFWYWEPSHTSMPGRRSTRPSNSWAWDYIPLFASTHMYRRISGKVASPDDAVLSFCLYIDDMFSPENRKAKGINGQPDAVTMPMGNAVLQAYVYRPLEVADYTFEQLWEKTPDDVTGPTGQMQKIGENMQAIGFEWALADVLIDTRPMLGTLRKHTE